MARPLEYGELVLLWEEKKGKSFLFQLQEGEILHTHKGTVAHGALVGLPEGSRVHSSTGTLFTVFRPRVVDKMMKVRRLTQIVYPKDAGWLLLALDLGPGMRVVEMGTGSGAFTILLAHAVGPAGKVYTFDRRGDFLENALRNIARAGLADRVEAGVLEAGEPFPVEGEVDAVFLDLPEPWVAVEPAHRVLAPGRPIALIVPTAEQLKQSVQSLKEAGFTALEAVEILERRMLVREREGVRPFERMIGFTGYLVAARKALPLSGP
ncbi:tRNA (adenine-N1)-methyltransferase [Candidatus Bipolaricaulota bacterium]|nr:tRNA (adenine-N1)-methyltransferase [Candidatus Bipolaricaulota bacterium]